MFGLSYKQIKKIYFIHHEIDECRPDLRKYIREDDNYDLDDATFAQIVEFRSFEHSPFLSVVGLHDLMGRCGDEETTHFTMNCDREMQYVWLEIFEYSSPSEQEKKETQDKIDAEEKSYQQRLLVYEEENKKYLLWTKQQKVIKLKEELSQLEKELNTSQINEISE